MPVACSLLQVPCLVRTLQVTGTRWCGALLVPCGGSRLWGRADTCPGLWQGLEEDGFMSADLLAYHLGDQ